MYDPRGLAGRSNWSCSSGGHRRAGLSSVNNSNTNLHMSIETVADRRSGEQTSDDLLSECLHSCEPLVVHRESELGLFSSSLISGVERKKNPCTVSKVSTSSLRTRRAQ
jgi:acyl transferase domain-containing protein